MLRFVVFDVDGTLIDSQQAIIQAIKLSAAKMGIDCPNDREQLLSGVGLPLREALHRVFPELERERLDQFTEIYRQSHFELASNPDTDLEPLFPYVREMLQQLRADNYILGICTSKTSRGLTRVLDRHGLSSAFSSIKTPENGPGKPDPYLLLEAMKEMQVDASETIFIGDSTFDIEAANRAKVASMAVSWGYHRIEDLEAVGATISVSRVEEIVPTIRAWK